MRSADHDFANHLAVQPAPLVTGVESQVETTIALLKQQLEEVRQREIKRTRRRLGQMSSTQENAIESLSHGIIDQILRVPITMLKATEEDDSLAVLETVHRIFNLGQSAFESEK